MSPPRSRAVPRTVRFRAARQPARPNHLESPPLPPTADRNGDKRVRLRECDRPLPLIARLARATPDAPNRPHPRTAADRGWQAGPSPTSHVPSRVLERHHCWLGGAAAPTSRMPATGPRRTAACRSPWPPPAPAAPEAGFPRVATVWLLHSPPPPP